MTLVNDYRSLPSIRPLIRRLVAGLAEIAPKGLYARALIIIIAPIVLLESVIAFVFMERHWQSVTRRLSESTAHDVAALIEIYQKYPQDPEHRQLARIARNFQMSLQILPAAELPPKRTKTFFDQLLDRTLTEELEKSIPVPTWVDTVGDSRVVEIRAKLDTSVLRVIVRRSQAYASNSHIFLLWMVGTSIVLLTVSILFLRNQIRPILRLGEAAEAFGKGRPIPEDFRPRGAREVRQASYAFIEMRDRIERHVEQRTTMLAGVSHDLRTILTRFKLQLALFEDTQEVEALRSDANEMQLMLEDYMAFAKGYSGEESRPVDVRIIIGEIREEVSRLHQDIDLTVVIRKRETVLPLKRQAFKRALTNLVNNAMRYGDKVIITCTTEKRWMRIEIEDNGPGIPADKREEVFRPFYRLDESRNQDTSNSGLGLAIARDIARSHGGDIWLEKSQLGGLKAIVRLPV
jgi:two-component system, OmpR family, osmolarity sensor histidine kinase EnvZ